MIKAFVKLIHALSSNTSPGEIAHAFSCGILLGFMPKDNLMWYILFILILFLRIQRSVLTVSIFVGALLTGILDPYFDDLGTYILTQKQLIPYYYKLLNIPFVAFTKFHNTIVMGSLVVGLLVYIPCCVVARLLIFIWRNVFAAKIKNTKIAKLIGQILKQVPFLQKLTDMVLELD